MRTVFTSLAVVGVSATTFLVNNTAQALTFDLFTGRLAWRIAAGGAANTDLEDFNSFTVDTQFGGGASLTAGDLTLVGNTNSPNEALIDVSPYSGAGSNIPTGIDGTAMVNLRGLDSGENVEVQLPGNFSAFGFNYENYDAQGDAIDVYVGTDLVASIPATQGDIGFIGFIATDGSFDTVEFRSNSNTGFGTYNAIDNVEWGVMAMTPETTPEPGAILGLLAVGSIGALSRKHKV